MYLTLVHYHMGLTLPGQLDGWKFLCHQCKRWLPLSDIHLLNYFIYVHTYIYIHVALSELVICTSTGNYFSNWSIVLMCTFFSLKSGDCLFQKFSSVSTQLFHLSANLLHLFIHSCN